MSASFNRRGAFQASVCFVLACQGKAEDNPPPSFVLIEADEVLAGDPQIYVFATDTEIRLSVEPILSDELSVTWVPDAGDPSEVPTIRTIQRESMVVRVQGPSTPTPGRGWFELRHAGAVRLRIRAELVSESPDSLEEFAESGGPKAGSGLTFESTQAWIKASRAQYKRGDYGAAVATATTGAAWADARGRLRSAAQMWLIARHAAVQAERLDEAMLFHDRASHYAARCRLGELTAELDYEEGLLALAAGDPPRAEAALQRAVHGFEASGIERHTVSVASVLAIHHAQLGRFQRAYDVLSRYAPTTETTTVAKAVHLSNRADVLMRWWMADPEAERAELALSLLDEAHELFLLAGELANARARRLEQAWWSAQAGLPEAAPLLAAIEHLPVPSEARSLPSLTRALLALRKQRPEAALRELEPLLGQLDSGLDPLDAEVKVASLALMAEALVAAGRVEEGIEAIVASLEEAMDIADALPLSSSPSAALLRREPIRKRALHMLLERGRIEDAFVLDDEYRRHVVRRLDPMNRLQTRKTSTLESVSGALQTGEEAWAWVDDAARTILFRVSDRGIKVRLGAGLRESLTEAVTEAHLDGEPLRHVYLVSDEDDRFLEVLDSGAMTPTGVTASLIPYASWLARERPPPLSRRRVVVANPTQDLWFAEEEGRWLSREWDDALVWIRSAPPVDRLLRELNGSQVFHFAGHGQLVGPDPWSTQLRLGDRGELSVADWAKARPGVGLVVLNGCTTGGYEARPNQIGFPQVMLKVGARVVLATTRPIRDPIAARFIRDFYGEDFQKDPASAFRSAVEASKGRRDRGWQAFRYWGWPRLERPEVVRLEDATKPPARPVGSVPTLVAQPYVP
ncbi:MAG: CHAT domain-containing protein [Myxococcota bacterium]